MGEDYFGIKLLHSSSSHISDFVYDKKGRKSKKKSGFKAEYVKEENTPSLPLLPYATINYLVEKKPADNNFRQDFVFKRLSARIESSLKEKLLPVLEVDKPLLSGIKLLSSSSDRFTAFKETPKMTVKKLKVKEKRQPSEIKAVIAEAAVDPEYVFSGEMCRGWKDTKKPRLTALRLVKSDADGSLTCEDVDT